MKRILFQYKWYIAAAIVVGMLTMLFFLDPSRYVLMPKCPFKLITGWSCPGCGIQRCLHALMHGRWAEALHYNYFLVYSLPYFLTVVFTEWGTKAYANSVANVYLKAVKPSPFIAYYLSYGE